MDQFQLYLGDLEDVLQSVCNIDSSGTETESFCKCFQHLLIKKQEAIGMEVKFSQILILCISSLLDSFHWNMG